MEYRYYSSQGVESGLPDGNSLCASSIQDRNNDNNNNNHNETSSSLWDTRTEHSSDDSRETYPTSFDDDMFSASTGRNMMSTASSSSPPRKNVRTQQQQNHAVDDSLTHSAFDSDTFATSPCPQFVSPNSSPSRNTGVIQRHGDVSLSPKEQQQLPAPTTSITTSGHLDTLSCLKPRVTPEKAPLLVTTSSTESSSSSNSAASLSSPKRNNINHNHIMNTNTNTNTNSNNNRMHIRPRSTTTTVHSINWRMDPETSLSDWELRIFNRTTKKFETYHVHRVVLAVGPRACGYFQDIFATSHQNNNNNNNLHNNTTTTTTTPLSVVPLIAGACRYVPDFLDFVYGQPIFAIRRETAVPLSFLADVFRQSRLKEHVEHFLEHDLTAETLQHYYAEATYYYNCSMSTSMSSMSSLPNSTSSNRLLLDRVLEVASRVMLIRKDAYENVLDFLEDVKPEHFGIILERMGDGPITSTTCSGGDDDRENDGKNVNTIHSDGGDIPLRRQQQQQHQKQNECGLASLIADYCILHQEELTLSIFEQMTEHLLLLLPPSPQANRSTTGTNTGTASTDNSSSSNNSKNNIIDAKAAVVLLQMDLVFREESELQTKCFQVLTDDWENLLKDLDPQTLKELLQRLSRTNKPIMMEWFHSTLTKAYQELVEARKDCTALHNRETSSIDERTELKAEVGNMKNRFSAAKLEMKEQVQGWIRKHSQEQIERQAEQAKYNQERLLWEVERRKMLEEKAQLEYQLAQALNLIQLRQSGPHLADNTCSVISDVSWDEPRDF